MIGIQSWRDGKGRRGDFRESACALVDLEHGDIVMGGIEDEDKPTPAVDSDQATSNRSLRGDPGTALRAPVWLALLNPVMTEEVGVVG